METPDQIGRYQIIRPLGRGGMADVFLARVGGLDDFEREYVVKLIRADVGDSERFTRYFIDEARITVQLQHPNIVQVFDLGSGPTGPYMGMEYVDGCNLRQLINWSVRELGRVPISLAVLIAREVLAGLAYAHEAAGEDGEALGIVHRDISPSNVLLGNTGTVKLSGFGVAHASIAVQKDGPRVLVGKAGYFSPEQLRGQPATQRSDLFSMGVVLFELFCGQPLVKGQTKHEIALKLERLDIRSRLEGIALPVEGLRDVLHGSLANQPSARFASARALLDVLEDCIYADRIRTSQDDLATFVSAVDEVEATEFATGTSMGEISFSMAPLYEAAGGEPWVEAVTPSSETTTTDSGGDTDAVRIRSLSETPTPPPVADLGDPEDHSFDREESLSLSIDAYLLEHDADLSADGLVALPDADAVTLFEPASGPRTLSGDDYDEHLDSAPLVPDQLVAFDAGEIRPFHEWFEQYNPTRQALPRGPLISCSGLSLGPTLLLLASRSPSTRVIQVFTDHEAVGLLVRDRRVVGSWDEASRTLAADTHLRRVLGWFACRVNALSLTGGGDDGADPGMPIETAILRGARAAFEVERFLRASPAVRRGAVGAVHDPVLSLPGLDLTETELEVAAELGPGREVRQLIAAPGGTVDPDNARALYALLCIGAVDLEIIRQDEGGAPGRLARRR